MNRRDLHWLLEVCGDFPERDKQLLATAYATADAALQNTFRENGDPMMVHATAVARMVMEDVGLPASAAIAALLHEAKAAGKETAAACGREIATMVDGLNRIAAIDIKDTHLQSENFRKLIVSYSTDPRVTIIKLCDRLEVMRSLDHFAKSRQAKKAAETLLLYAPIAHQLGLYNIKSELEDLSLKYTDPEAYRTITAKLKIAAADRDRLLQRFLQPIEEKLQAEHIGYEIKSRTKSVYSIWKKMKAQAINFEKISDIYATRIILDTPPAKDTEDAACWRVFSFIQEIYPHIDDSRTRDWLSQPRKSGYRSLHITVRDSLSTQAVEVQIRTTRMDDEAERGAAAHWRYKGLKDMGSMQDWLDKTRQLLETPNDTDGGHFADLRLNEIIVLTPTGDLRRLPAGASVLDFAFDLHSNLGLRFAGAKVNGVMVPIRHTLQTGDVIEVLTAKKAQPAADWLNYVVTGKARTHIRQKLREEETKRSQAGKELLERRLKNWKMASLDEAIPALLKRYRLKTITELYAAIADEKINLSDIKEQLTAAHPEPAAARHPHEHEPETPLPGEPSGNFLFVDQNLKNTSYKLAKCCNPILGDEIFGFVTIGDGIKIHRLSCPNAARLLDKYPYRVIQTRWKSTAENNFLVHLRLVGHDETGLPGTVIDTIAQTGCQLRAVHFAAGRKGNIEGEATILIKNNQQLDLLLSQLRHIKGMEKAFRVKS